MLKKQHLLDLEKYFSVTVEVKVFVSYFFISYYDWSVRTLDLDKLVRFTRNHLRENITSLSLFYLKELKLSHN